MTASNSTCGPAPTAALHWQAGVCIAVYFLTALYNPTGIPGIVIQLFRGVLFFLTGYLTFRALYLAADEFQRILQVRALLFALVILLAVTSIWGHAASFARTAVPAIPTLILPGAFIVIATLAKIFIYRKANT